MALTAKTSSAQVNAEGKTQNARGEGNIEPGFQIGANQVRRIACAQYDFTRDGSPTAHATAGMGLGVYLPANSVVLRSYAFVNTLFAGATNVYVSLENDGDLMASGTIAANELDATGDFITLSSLTLDAVADATTVTTAAEFVTGALGNIKTTAAREIVLGCTVANLTAGKVTIFVEYVVVA